MLQSILGFVESEPVRVRLYAIALLVIAEFTRRGLLDPGSVNFYASVVAAVLAVENTRGKVVPAASTKPSD